MTQSSIHFWRDSLIAISVTVAILFFMGQPIWCKCGMPFISSWNIWSLHNSQHFIDPYTFSHVLHGVIFFWCLSLLPDRFSNQQKFLFAVLLECGWEILENSPIIINRYRTATLALEYSGDSILNSVADVFACILGYQFASRFRITWAVVAFLAIELISLIAIRDGLVLNVLMLLTPIDAIKEWQMGGS